MKIVGSKAFIALARTLKLACSDVIPLRGLMKVVYACELAFSSIPSGPRPVPPALISGGLFDRLPQAKHLHSGPTHKKSWPRAGKSYLCLQ